MTKVITLTTDFGHKGPFVAIMKGVILGRAPDARVIDLTHEVFAHWPAEAGFWLSRAYRWFPPGTVHVAVVDPGVGTSRDIIAGTCDGHIFVAPDNGLLPLVFGDTGAARVFRLDESWRRRQDWPAPSATFHGRDIFAPLAAALAAGHTRPEDIGPAAGELVPSLLDAPVTQAGRVQGSVIAIDHFGNLITNIEDLMISDLRSPSVSAAGRLFALKKTYGDAKPGDLIALINSFGVLEIACAEGSAADRLGLGHGAPVTARQSDD